MNKLKEFLSSNSASMKLARTLLQAVIGIFISNLDVLIAGVSFIPVEYKAFTATLIMAILSPIMHYLGMSVNTEGEVVFEEIDIDDEGAEEE